MDRIEVSATGGDVVSAAKVFRADARHPDSVGARLDQLTSVVGWFRAGFFANNDEFRGALALAFEQAKDGMGDSIAGWLGMTAYEFDTWRRSGELPGKRARHTRPPPRNDEAAKELAATSETQITIPTKGFAK